MVSNTVIFQNNVINRKFQADVVPILILHWIQSFARELNGVPMVL